MAGIHQTLKEARDLYAEALKLQEAVLASHRELKGFVAQVQTWHEASGELMAQARDVDDAAQESWGPLSSLGFHALPLGGVFGWFSRAAGVPGRWRMREKQ